MLNQNDVNPPARSSPASGRGGGDVQGQELQKLELPGLNMAALKGVEEVRSACELHAFLQSYVNKRLVPVELPTIASAFHHTTRGEGRELVALDNKMRGALMSSDLARASQRAGRRQLRKLRPLRDHLVVRRYLDAVEQGEARGWHTVVFGLVLGVYALPLRQGLIHYAAQTMDGFLRPAAFRLRMADAEIESLTTKVMESIPDSVDDVIVETSGALGLIVF